MIEMMNWLHIAQNLKMELRHSWLEDGRQESVAEHTWRMALMAVFVQRYLDQPIQMERLLKMILIHDLAEAKAGDIPAFHTAKNEQLKREKEQREREVMKELRITLPKQLGEELYELWLEYEQRQTYEAKVANALDKLEVQIQHNEAPISTWLDIECEMTYQLGKHVQFDSFLQKLKDEIEREGHEKLVRAGRDIHMK